MKMLLIIFGGLIFICAGSAHLWIKFKLRPKQDSDLDEIYWEFENTHPGLARYNRLSRITFAATAIGVLLLFLALVF